MKRLIDKISKINLRIFKKRISVGSIISRRFVKDAIFLQAGEFITNFLSAIVSIVIARILLPDKYGIYSLALSLASLIGMGLNWGNYDAGLTKLSEVYGKQDKQETKSILTFLFKSAIYISIIGILGLIVAPFIAKIFYQNWTIGFLAMIAIASNLVSLFFGSITPIILQVSGRIKQLSILETSQNILKYLAMLLFVLFGWGAIGAISGQFFTSIIFAIIFLVVFNKLTKTNKLLPELKEITQSIKGFSIKKYLGFGFLIAIDKNISSLFRALPIILAGIYVSVSQVAFFKIAFSYISLALIFASPISRLLNVKFPIMKGRGDNELLVRNFRKISLYSMILTFALTMLAMIFAPVLFHIFYGQQYSASISYVYLFIGYGAIVGLGVGLGPMFRALNKVKISILINLTSLAIGIPLALILVKNLSIPGIIIALTIWYAISIIAAFIYLNTCLKKIEKNNGRKLN